MHPITFALLPLLLMACAPTVPTVELSAAETQAIEAALLKDFWGGNKPHSVCAFRALGREGEKVYVYYNCQHWYREAEEWRMSGGSGPAVVTLGASPAVKLPRDGDLFAKDIRALFPASLYRIAGQQGPSDFYNSLNAEAEAKAKAAP